MMIERRLFSPQKDSGENSDTQEGSLGHQQSVLLMLLKFLVTLQEGGLLFNAQRPENLYTISRAPSGLSG